MKRGDLSHIRKMLDEYQGKRKEKKLQRYSDPTGGAPSTRKRHFEDLLTKDEREIEFQHQQILQLFNDHSSEIKHFEEEEEKSFLLLDEVCDQIKAIDLRPQQIKQDPPITQTKPVMFQPTSATITNSVPSMSATIPTAPKLWNISAGSTMSKVKEEMMRLEKEEEEDDEGFRADRQSGMKKQRCPISETSRKATNGLEFRSDSSQQEKKVEEFSHSFSEFSFGSTNTKTGSATTASTTTTTNRPQGTNSTAHATSSLQTAPTNSTNPGASVPATASIFSFNASKLSEPTKVQTPPTFQFSTQTPSFSFTSNTSNSNAFQSPSFQTPSASSSTLFSVPNKEKNPVEFNFKLDPSKSSTNEVKHEESTIPKITPSVTSTTTSPRPKVFLEFEINSEPLGKVICELYHDLVPLTTENFRALCTGEKVKSFALIYIF